MNKLHSNLLYGLHKMLVQAFCHNEPSKKVFRKFTSLNRKWGKRDRDFLANHFYTIIRYLRKYCYLSNQTESPFFQLDFWKIIKVHFLLLHYELPSFLFKQYPDLNEIEQLFLDSLPFPIEHSYPDWFYEKMISFYGKERAEEELIALNQPPLPVLRVNRIKVSINQVCKELSRYQIPYRLLSSYPDAIVLEKHVRVDRLPVYHKGWVEIQDAGSQAIGLLCPVQPGYVVIDACAGAGGKSLHLASLMKNQGKIFACDINNSFLQELENRKKRAGASIIQTHLITSFSSLTKLPMADLVLIDAPCSGSGTIRRHPELKWRWTPKDLPRLTQTQYQVLKNYSSKVKKEGYLVYATCSLFPDENQFIIHKFLNESKDFEMELEKNIFPSEGFDGFYICRLKRKRLP